MIELVPSYSPEKEEEKKKKRKTKEECFLQNTTKKLLEKSIGRLGRKAQCQCKKIGRRLVVANGSVYICFVS